MRETNAVREGVRSDELARCTSGPWESPDRTKLPTGQPNSWDQQQHLLLASGRLQKWFGSIERGPVPRSPVHLPACTLRFVCRPNVCRIPCSPHVFPHQFTRRSEGGGTEFRARLAQSTAWA